MDEHKVDVVSSLPDELLLHMISFLPFESARLTPFLSKRWRVLWNRTLVQHGAKEDIPSAVSRFIRHFDEHEPARNIRKLQFHFDKGNFVLAIVAPRNVLRLIFSSDINQETSGEFSCPLEINVPDQILTSVPVSSSFFVKTLCLVSVNHLTSEMVSSMVLGFPFLENVKILSCSGLTSLSVDSAAKLLHLIILDCPKLKYLQIRSFKLKTLRYRGFFPLIKIREHFNLTDAMFDIRQGPSYNSFSILDFGPVLLIIKNSEILTLCRWMFEELICPSLSSFQAAFRFYKLKELWWIDDSIKQENIHSLICFLKLCPSIECLFITIDPNTYTSSRTLSFSNQVGKCTKLPNLRLVKLEGSTSQEDEILLAAALQEIVDVQPLILSPTSDSDHVLRSARSIQLDGDTWFHQFSEVKYTTDLCPKHPHMCLI